MPLLSRLSYVMLQKEGTQGTAASSGNKYFIPVQDAQGEELPHYVNDDSLANNASLIRGVYQGERDSTFTYNGFLYPEIVGPHMVAMGFADTLSASTTHTFKVPSAGTQPPSYTINDYDVVANRQWAGMVADQLDWTFDAKGGVKQTFKWLGWTSASSASSAPSWPTTNPFLGWQTSVTVGGVATTRFVSAGVTIKRSTEVIHTLGNTQNPYNVFAGPVEANLKIQAIVENYTEWNQLINNTQPAIVLTATSTTGSSSVLTITSTSTAWTKATISRKGKYLVLDAEITGIQNSTDVGPMGVVITNASGAAY